MQTDVKIVGGHFVHNYEPPNYRFNETGQYIWYRPHFSNAFIVKGYWCSQNVALLCNYYCSKMDVGCKVKVKLGLNFEHPHDPPKYSDYFENCDYGYRWLSVYTYYNNKNDQYCMYFSVSLLQCVWYVCRCNCRRLLCRNVKKIIK